MQCPKCHSRRMKEISSWDITSKEEENFKRQRAVIGYKASMHQSNSLSLVITAATVLYKGLATKMFRCESCGHKVRT